MKTLILVLASLLPSFAEEVVPKEVHEIREALMNDPDHPLGLNYAKKGGSISPSVSPSDVFVDVPVAIFHFKKDKVAEYDGTQSFDQMIFPIDRWIIPFKVNNEYSYAVKIGKRNGKYEDFGSVSGMGTQENIWSEIRRKYPTETGVTPIWIHDGPRRYFYFKNIPQGGLFMDVRRSKDDSLYAKDDSLLLKASRSLDSLDSPEKLLPHIKEYQLRRKAKMEKFRTLQKKTGTSK